MPSQASLPLAGGNVDLSAYKRFAIPEHYPIGEFQSLHPRFEKRGKVLTGTTTKSETFVDMTIGECECQDGFAFKYDQKQGHWYKNRYCIHKMRMLSSIVESSKDDLLSEKDRTEITKAYMNALSTRYNKYETISAFHKELRRGDFEKAWFWGMIASAQRRIRGVMQYLLNIVYEETRDHELASFLIKARSSDRYHNLKDMTKAIAWFCAAKKKWELPYRFDVFSAEMEGYMRLVKAYGKEVAGHGNVIASTEKGKLYRHMTNGFAAQDQATFQHGLKGLQKLQYGDNEKHQYNHRYEIYEWLYDKAHQFLDSDHPVWTVIEVVNEKIAADLGIGYHDLNTIGDALMGEPLHGGLPAAVKRAIALRPSARAVIGQWPEIPLYAHDNHSYKGKALMRRYPDQLKPGVEQTDIDFRWCGAYFGVAYRMIAFRQHGGISEWEQVKWPQELYKAVDTLWY